MKKKVDYIKIKAIIGFILFWLIQIIALFYPLSYFSESIRYYYLGLLIVISIISLYFMLMYVFKTAYPKEYERFKKYK